MPVRKRNCLQHAFSVRQDETSYLLLPTSCLDPIWNCSTEQTQKPAARFLILRVRGFHVFGNNYSVKSSRFPSFRRFLFLYICLSARSKTGATLVSSCSFAMPQAMMIPPVREATAL